MKAETLRALKNARDLAMKNTLAARIPECGDFGHIAQDLDYVLNDIEAYTAPPRVVWFDGKSPPKENGLPVLCKVEFDEGYFFDVGEYDDDHWIAPSLEKPTVFTNARVVGWTHLEPIAAALEQTK